MGAAEIRRDRGLHRMASRSSSARIHLDVTGPLRLQGCQILFRWGLALKALRARIRILCLKGYRGMGHRKDGEGTVAVSLLELHDIGRLGSCARSFLLMT